MINSKVSAMAMLQEGEDQALACINDEQDDKRRESRKEGAGNIVAMHRVRGNVNKGGGRWLYSGGAAGIGRCRENKWSDVDICLAMKR
ncbi:hypothetical protein SADUNF_Sadunf16G0031200 [Salix dunnii]|uniref:Uncharacterized protein n=1 Tax=Salix dunnii TaxID=1413687 RepID=A0A835JA43_9ROSI|nr:hypothetical protein SADUNF_Sadunf16G0031200 [Salix dunnii]